jgi:hypothetical protein
MSLNPVGEMRPISNKFDLQQAPMIFAAPIRCGQEFENCPSVLVRLLRGSHRGNTALNPTPNGECRLEPTWVPSRRHQAYSSVRSGAKMGNVGSDARRGPVLRADPGSRFHTVQQTWARNLETGTESGEVSELVLYRGGNVGP